MTHWRVRLVKRRTIKVWADYHVIEQGCLKFRIQRRGTYPDNVIAIAHGQWVTVESLDAEETIHA